MYIKELDSICDSLQNQDNNQSEIRKIVNLFRIGLREDYWGSLSISDLDQVLSRIGKTRHELRKIDEKGETSERATAFDMILGQDEALREHTVSKPRLFPGARCVFPGEGGRQTVPPILGRR